MLRIVFKNSPKLLSFYFLLFFTICSGSYLLSKSAHAKEENLISIGGTPRANKSIIELETAIINEFKNIIENDSISDEEISRIKSRVIASNVYKFDSVFYQAMQVGMLETKGFKWQLLDSYINNIMSADYSDLKRVTEKYILNTKYLTSTVIPK